MRAAHLRHCVRHRAQALAARGADQRHWRAHFLRKRVHVHRSAAPFQIVRHVEDNQGGQAQVQDRRRQQQMPAQVGRVQNQ